MQSKPAHKLPNVSCENKQLDLILFQNTGMYAFLEISSCCFSLDIRLLSIKLINYSFSIVTYIQCTLKHHQFNKPSGCCATIMAATQHINSSSVLQHTVRPKKGVSLPIFSPFATNEKQYFVGHVLFGSVPM